MKIIYLLLANTIYFLVSCTPWKSKLSSTGKRDEAIQNAVLDFTHTDKLREKYSTFSVRTDALSEAVIGVGIAGNLNKWYVISTGQGEYSYRAIPENYYLDKDRLYVWYDSTKAPNQQLISLLSKRGLIDTVINGQIGEFRTDDGKKAAHYYFCKSNLRIYKKIHTSRGMGWYAPPVVKCKKSN